MKNLTTLQIKLLANCGKLCGIDTELDEKYIEGRVASQGQEFLTIVLPTFGKALEQALARGFVLSSSFSGFKTRKGRAIPDFLSGFVSEVFDPVTGSLYFDRDLDHMADCIRAVRQVTGFSAKIERSCSPERVEQAFSQYVEIEKELHAFQVPDLDEFSSMASLLFGQDVFHPIEAMLRANEVRPMHGPGSVADGLSANERWVPTLLSGSWHQRLEDSFPLGENLYTSWRFFLEDLQNGALAAWPGPELPVKVIQVPKTMKTPRIIAMEPSAVMYLQQGLQSCFSKFFHTSRYGRMVDYSSQVPNQELARQGSIDGSLATLDLSEASDRVHYSVAIALFRDFPLLGLAMDSVRSRTADVSSFGVIPLAKYASMGSAVCFPVEAMVFLTIVFLSIKHATGLSSMSVLRHYGDAGKVRVYGDDIIVPTNLSQAVMDDLESFGLKVNRSKSFTEGNFRESCGSDYWNGIDVGYCRIRHDMPSRQQSRDDRVESISATVSLRNELFVRGLWDVVAWLDPQIEKDLKGFFPPVESTSRILGRTTFLPFGGDRVHPHLQHPLSKGWVRDDPIPSDILDGVGALNKTLRDESELPNPDPKHLLRGGRPRVRRIKLGWYRPF